MSKNATTIISFIIGLLVSLVFGWGLIARAKEISTICGGQDHETDCKTDYNKQIIRTSLATFYYCDSGLCVNMLTEQFEGNEMKKLMLFEKPTDKDEILERDQK